MSDEQRYLLGAALMAAALTVLFSKFVEGTWGTVDIAVLLVVGVWIVLDRQLQGRVPYFGPRLDLSFDPAITYATHPTIPDGRPTFWVHLLVANRGKWAATKCECWLDALSVPSGGTFQKHPGYQTKSRLQWAHEILSPHPYTMDEIAPDDPKRVDFVSGDSLAPGQAALCIEPKPGSLRILEPGPYRVKVIARARNTKSVSRDFNVTVEGWNTVTVSEVTP